ncbi:MAG: hypothetical protein ACP5UI_02340 [Thermoprotei archaeon]
MAWFLRSELNGSDAYPMLRERLDNRVYTDPTHPAYRDIVRVETFRWTGYYSAEDSNHLSEYLPYFRRSPGAVVRYRLLNHTQRLDGMYRRVLEERRAMEAILKGEPMDVKRSGEFGPQVVHAIESGEKAEIYCNVSNDGLISNLPQGCTVEVPALVDGRGIHPRRVGAIPPQCASLNRSNVAVQELVTRAIEEKSRERVF